MRRRVRASKRLRAALGGVVTAGLLAGAAGAQAAEFDRTDLDFILTQIDIAEKHAAGQALFVPDVPATPEDESLTGLVPKISLPYGLRTVSGADNNIVPNQSLFGAADRLFPRLTSPLFRDVTWDPDGPLGPAPPLNRSYTQTSGNVFDTKPREASNAIVDQTSHNPAASAAYEQNDRPGKAIIPDNDPGSDLYFIPNRATDEGLSASYNSWFTLFGQFFDHGLDLVNKGGNGSVMVPLEPGDPLFDHPGPDGVRGDDPSTPDDPAIPGTQNDESADDPPNFMILSRATQVGNHEAVNQTTPFVDQNQTYTSHPSHQAFLREHEVIADPTSSTGQRTVATGRFLDDANGGLATWLDIKNQAADLLGITLTDQDLLNVPLLRTDQYGRLITGPNGLAQIGTGAPANPTWVPANGGPLPAGTIRTGHAFLDDIAHAAAPSGDLDGRGSTTTRGPLTPDPDSALGLTQAAVDLPQHYDDELLNRHFITGDGRGNENIGLTTVHFVFHAEHNRLAQQVKDLAFESGDLAFLNKWLRTPVASIPATPAGLAWNGERIFQAARFGTEMQYQHLVFEEFARKMQPEVDIFAGYHTEIDPAIVAEFAHTVYRFGHSMLDETVPRVDNDGVTADNTLGLIEAFLNPVEFGAPYGNDPRAAAGSIVRGTTRQVGNELDEFITGALRNNLLGLPLDLATLNLARGRDTGIPPLNSARRQFFAATQHPNLTPYESWTDFKAAIRHPESLVNFIAAYGRHAALDAETTIDGKRAVAYALVYGADGADGVSGNGDDPTVPVPGDRVDFMNSTPGSAHANAPDGTTVTGVDEIDLWIGGLAERQMPFGGLLGPTFNYVFETQMEKLQNGDRFYYLTRTAGLHFLTQLEENSFAELIMKHTDTENLPFDVFSRPDLMFDVGNSGPTGPITDNPSTPDDESTMTRMNDGTIRFIGGEHIVLAGDGDADKLRADDGDDTVWGNGGGDVIEGGAGNDALNGNAGDDIIKDNFGIDNIKGGPGNDAISVGAGTGDLTLAGEGDDFVGQGDDEKEAFLGAGDDLIRGSDGIDTIFGDEGDDWIEGGAQADLLQGGHGGPFQTDGAADPANPAAPIVHTGHDVIMGDGGDDDYDSEGGNDIMLTGPGVERNEGMLGFDWVSAQHDPQAASYDMRFTGLLPPDLDALRDRFDLVEGLSGAEKADILRGDDRGGIPPAEVVPGVIEGTSVDHELRFEHLGLITGLDDVLAGVPAPLVDDDNNPNTPNVPSTVIRFTDGNILLGGDGNDIIEGRGGNDVIDGDKWLKVELGAGSERFPDTRTKADGSPAGSPTLQARMMSGNINPGSIDVIRSIQTAPAATSTDTVVFSGPRSEYTISALADGVRVAHTGGTGADGTDIVKNVEFLQFTDVLVSVGAIGANNPPTGQPAISDSTPDENQLLTASIGTLADADGINLASLIFTWQMETPAGWVSLADAVTFTPLDGQAGRRLRVVATYQDNQGVVQSVASDPTAPVTDQANNTPATGAPVIISATENPLEARPRVGDQISIDTTGIADANGVPGVFVFQWQQSANGGATWTDILGATTLNFTPTPAQIGDILRVRVSFNDGDGFLETLFSAPTRDTRQARGNARLLALAGTVVPRALGSDVVEFRGVPVSFRVPAGARVVQVRLFQANGSKAVLAKAFVNVKAGKTSFKLRSPQVIKVLKKGGKFKIELRPGLSKTELGKTTVKLVTVWKVRVR